MAWPPAVFVLQFLFFRLIHSVSSAVYSLCGIDVQQMTGIFALIWILALFAVTVSAQGWTLLTVQNATQRGA